MGSGRRTRRDFLKGMAGIAAGTALGALRSRGEEAGRGPDRPNVVLIVADDLGRECLTSYGGGSFRTPTLDALADGGMRFAHCYATPWCAPSRAQLLTGRYPFRSYRKWGDLDTERERTFAGILSAAGYATAAAGKWQLCYFHQPGQGDHPQRAGFQESSLWTGYFDAGGGGAVQAKYWSPSVWENGRLRPGLEGRYGPDVFCDFLIDFIERQRSGPFLAYYPMLLPHGPFEPTPGSGLAVRALGRLPSRVQGRFNGLFFADYLEYLDRNVARIVETLDRLRLRQRTLVLITSDNGTDPRIRSSFAGRAVQGGKGQLTDLGIRVPLVASWPGTVPASAVSDDLVDLSDFLPTLAELAASPLPEVTLDGRSFLPALLGRRGRPRDWVYIESHYQERQGGAVRSRDWKLLTDGRLFDMRQDPFEERPILPGGGGHEAAEARLQLRSVLERLEASGRQVGTSG